MTAKKNSKFASKRLPKIGKNFSSSERNELLLSYFWVTFWVTFELLSRTLGRKRHFKKRPKNGQKSAKNRKRKSHKWGESELLLSYSRVTFWVTFELLFVFLGQIFLSYFSSFFGLFLAIFLELLLVIFFTRNKFQKHLSSHQKNAETTVYQIGKNRSYFPSCCYRRNWGWQISNYLTRQLYPKKSIQNT